VTGRRLEAGVNEAIAIDDFSLVQSNWGRKHGAIVNAGVKLAALSAPVKRETVWDLAQLIPEGYVVIGIRPNVPEIRDQL
jgi:hypothetical protein